MKEAMQVNLVVDDESVKGRRADASDNDAAIVAAARRLIERDGAIGSIREVAREAGLGSTTVYRRFSTKEELQSRAHAELLCDQIAPVVARAKGDPDPMAGLRRITDELIGATSGPPRTEATLTDLVEVFLRRFRDDLETLMAAAQDAGTLRPDIVADDIARITVLMFAGLALPANKPGATDRYVTLLFDGLSRRDVPPLPPVA